MGLRPISQAEPCRVVVAKSSRQAAQLGPFHPISARTSVHVSYRDFAP